VTDADPRIVIIGAGPAGLSAAYYLKQRGYRNVILLEKLGRVGGLCKTITCDGHAFDLGANYITPAYREIRRMAAEVGATMYSERPFVAMTVPADGGPVTYKSIFSATRVDAKTGTRIGLLTLLAAILKFIWLRFRLAKVVDRPTMAGVEQHDDLCEPFGAWLHKYNLQCLTSLFELPITMMGYGYLDQTPAIYALKFMTLRTFIPMVLKETPWIGPWTGWPKRFVDGYQRFWERMSWQFDVHCNVTVRSVERQDGRIRVRLERTEQELSKLDYLDDTLEADHVILACPLGTVHRVMDLSEEEKDLFPRIRAAWYCMTTLHVRDLDIGDHVSGGGPLAAVYPMTPMLNPWGVAKQWKDCDFVQFYTPVYPWDLPGSPSPWGDDEDPVKGAVIGRIYETVRQMGGRIVDERRAWETYNRWTYFQHVTTDELRRGFYSRLEALQGERNTYYVGGATSFELVEPIAEYAKHLVARHFPARRGG
jgi:hypothetical protein